MEDTEPVRAFREALDYCYKNRGWAQKHLADHSGLAQSTISALLNRKAGKRQETQTKIANAFGYDLVDFLALGRRILSGDDRPDVPPPAGLAPVVVAESGQDIEDLKGQIDYFRPVPLYESGSVAAGPSGTAFDYNEKPDSSVLVYRPELGHRAKHQLRATRVIGDSMEPVIPEGSIVVVDMDDRRLVDGRIYAIARTDIDIPLVASIKRVHPANEAFVLLSENKDYPPEVVAVDWPELCVGRVVWMWRNVEEA